MILATSRNVVPGLAGAAMALLLACAESKPARSEPAAPAGPGHGNAEEAAASLAVPTATFAYDGKLIQGGYILGTAPANTKSARIGDQPLDLAGDNRFFAAFDRDAPETLTLKATLESGETVRERLSIARRDWPIERVNVPKRSGGASEAWWQKRKPEWEAIVAARETETSASGWSQDFIWPVEGRISGRFGRQRIYQGEPGNYHSGIDIAPGYGVPFVAPADGVVVLAREGFSLEGNLIIIDHGMGLNSAFLHASRIVVEEGQAVRQGAHIGDVGSSGRATGPHLHWSLKWKDWRLDPLLLVGPMD
jgi:hypothetical protein